MQIRRFHKDNESVVGFVFKNNLYGINGEVLYYSKTLDESATRVKPKIRAEMEKLYKNLVEINKLDEQIRKLNKKQNDLRIKKEKSLQKIKAIYQSEKGITTSNTLIDKIIDMFEKTSLKDNVSKYVRDGISKSYVYYDNYNNYLRIYIPVNIITHPQVGEYESVYREYDGSMHSRDMSECQFNIQLAKAQFKKWSSLKSFIDQFEIKDKRIKTTFNFGACTGDKTAELYFEVFYDFSKEEFKKEEVSEILKKFKNIAKTL